MDYNLPGCGVKVPNIFLQAGRFGGKKDGACPEAGGIDDREHRQVRHSASRRRGDSHWNRASSATGSAKVRVRITELVRRVVSKSRSERRNHEAWAIGRYARPVGRFRQEVPSRDGNSRLFRNTCVSLRNHLCDVALPRLRAIP